jgi:hypothetical protein
MATEELIAIVKEKFQQGKRRSEIKEELWNDGYSEEDIDQAITKIQHDAIKQLPGISWFYRIIDDFESKGTLTTPRMTVILMICCIVALLLLAGGLYIVFDPLGTQATARDSARQDDMIKLQNALSAYYQVNHRYPATLGKLVPEFISTVPKDPTSGTTYSYHTTNNAGNYQICVTFELKIPQCANAPMSNQEIPILPTETPVPSFVPHSAAGTQKNQAM